ncbi:hypothetical protein UT300012_21560 [Paraclostridium bifermentans]
MNSRIKDCEHLMICLINTLEDRDYSMSFYMGERRTIDGKQLGISCEEQLELLEKYLGHLCIEVENKKPGVALVMLGKRYMSLIARESLSYRLRNLLGSNESKAGHPGIRFSVFDGRMKPKYSEKIDSMLNCFTVISVIRSMLDNDDLSICFMNETKDKLSITEQLDTIKHYIKDLDASIEIIDMRNGRLLLGNKYKNNIERQELDKRLLELLKGRAPGKTKRKVFEEI